MLDSASTVSLPTRTQRIAILLSLKREFNKQKMRETRSLIFRF